MLIVPEARADIPIPAVFGLMAPTWLAVLTFGVSLAVVVAVEAIALFALLDVGLGRALWLSLIANGITTAYGFIFFGGGAGILLLMLCLAVVLLPLVILNESMSRFHSLATLLILAPVPVMLALYPLGVFALGQSTSGLFLSLIPALCVTTLIEVFVLRAFQPDTPFLRATAVANGTSYALIALTLWGVGMRGEENPILTPDYLCVMEAPRRIAAGDMEGVFELVDQIREFHLGTRVEWGPWLSRHQPGPGSWLSEYGYPPWDEQRIARDLAAKGYVAEAIEVLEFLLEAPGLREEEAQITRERIAELEARLAREGE
jgi:hypothetical protein